MYIYKIRVLRKNDNQKGNLNVACFSESLQKCVNFLKVIMGVLTSWMGFPLKINPIFVISGLGSI